MTELSPRDPAECVAAHAAPPDLSVVVPMYNEEEAVAPFFAEVVPELERLGVSWEIICVNDGSRDRTLDCLLDHRARDKRIVVLDLSRNFGKEAALTAGLEHATGRAVVPMDVDLQDPPALLGEMLAKWREGYDVVFGVRISRDSDTWAKKLTALGFYRLINSISAFKIPENAGDFRLMDARVVADVNRLRERTRFMKGLFAWVGYRQTAVTYSREPRTAGTSKWNYWKLWNFALDGITSFTTAPLRIWTYIGLSVAALSFLYGFYLIVRTLFTGADVPGYASLMVAILFLNGLQMVSLGILGEYVGRLFHEAKQRPVYLLRETHGVPRRESTQ
ncbi:glycosyltransferase family 2 protein [uncultured Rhodospira sp.]|uniref:glycosyltransferase family 2 protein n=1 Tax=uncultured Rhodospira sp. TaxID=1936189 RepID=UPI00260E55CA|nr:glycosyltransferase family 2 protein [uncultured Rhodospira sp.]